MKNNFETFGNYILLEKLAAGGMAEVYLAKKLAAGGVQKFVAIKRILQQFSDSKDFIQMFKDEAKIAINLSHSNVVSIYDFGTQNGQFFIVMEFVEGRNLRQTLNRMKRVNQQFSIGQVAHIIKQVAAGLEHAHKCIDPTTGKPLNIIHRDMSPQNVMLGFEGDAKIVDFGIAKAAHQIEATRAGTLKGKFGYMSPEQVEGQSIDSRTDIFAIGIMAWEMLANQRLFLANSEINTLRKIRECDVPSLRKINPNIPAELDQIVKKALEKDKLERYQNSADLQQDMQGFLSRFDPDFSVQDLSKFTKNLFSEEIIQIRKKQIVYAQVTVQNEEAGDKTHVVGNTQFDTDDMSLDNISFQTIGQTKEKPVKQPMQKVSGDLSFVGAEFDDDATKSQRLHVAKRNAHKKSEEYKNKTFIDMTQTGIENKKNTNATLLTIIFSLSLLLAFFGYLNKYHPNFKVRFCKSTANYGICPRSFYIPKNLVTLSTSPAGASVYINGELLGKSPQDILIKNFPIQIVLKKDGYRVVNRVLTEIPSNNSLNLSLVQAPSAYITVKAVGVQIFVDGVIVKSDKRVSVPAGREIEVKAYDPINGISNSKFFTLKPGEEKRFFMTSPSANDL